LLHRGHRNVEKDITITVNKKKFCLMGKQTTMTYALNILQKHQKALETNLKETPGIIMNEKMMPVYKRQLREVKKAIQYLELEEFTREEKLKISTNGSTKFGPGL
jgi:hypothetical protein